MAQDTKKTDDRYASERIADLQAKFHEAEMRASRLSRLQRLFATANLEDGPKLIYQAAAKEIASALGFRRVIVFESDGANLVPSVIYDERDPVPDVSDYERIPQPNLMSEMLRLHGEAVSGTQADLTAPLYDIREWYVCAPIMRGDTRAIIYGDDPSSKTKGPWTIETLSHAAALLGILIDSARLLQLQRQQTAQAEHLAMHDALTGLHNRRAFEDRLHAEVSRQKRECGSFCYVEVDVDNFKRVNDTLGHDGGDRYLVKLARTLEASVREEDIVARLGGDEFAILLPSADQNAAHAVISRVYEALKANALPCSIGAAVYPIDGTDEDAIAKSADNALYQAKERGKNTFCFATLAAA